MKLEQIREELKNIRERISFYGGDITGFSAYHEHPTNGSDVLIMVSDNELLFKYDCYLSDSHESLSVIYHANIINNEAYFSRDVYHTIKSKTKNLRKFYEPEDFFEDMSRLIDSIEKDPTNLTYYTGYQLSKKYVKFRNQVDSGPFEIYDWEIDRSLQSAFDDELWENAEEGDQIDIDDDLWLDLNHWYEKSDHSKRVTGMITK